jgi:hypothetical protein
MRRLAPAFSPVRSGKYAITARSFGLLVVSWHCTTARKHTYIIGYKAMSATTEYLLCGLPHGFSMVDVQGAVTDPGESAAASMRVADVMGDAGCRTLGSDSRRWPIVDEGDVLVAADLPRSLPVERVHFENTNTVRSLSEVPSTLWIGKPASEKRLISTAS